MYDEPTFGGDGTYYTGDSTSDPDLLWVKDRTKAKVMTAQETLAALEECDGGEVFRDRFCAVELVSVPISWRSNRFDRPDPFSSDRPDAPPARPRKARGFRQEGRIILTPAIFVEHMAQIEALDERVARCRMHPLQFPDIRRNFRDVFIPVPASQSGTGLQGHVYNVEIRCDSRIPQGYLFFAHDSPTAADLNPNWNPTRDELVRIGDP